MLEIRERYRNIMSGRHVLCLISYDGPTDRIFAASLNVATACPYADGWWTVRIVEGVGGACGRLVTAFHIVYGSSYSFFYNTKTMSKDVRCV